MTHPTKEAARAASIEQIRKLLAEKDMTAYELSQHVSVPRNTLHHHLAHMDKTLRAAHRTGEMRDRSPIWSLGPDPAVMPNDDRDHIATTKRDPLVAALFGPATK